MALIPISQRWTKQPPAANLAASSVNRGLVVAAMPWLGRELVSGQPLTPVGGPTLANVDRGRTGRTNGSSSYWTVSFPARSLAAFSMLAIVRGSGSQGLDTRAFTVASSSSDQPLIMTNVSASNITKARTFWRDNAGNYAASLPDTSADVFRTDRTTVFGFRVESTSGSNVGQLRTFVDGAPDAVSSGYLPSGITVNRASIGCLHRASAGSFFNGDVLMGLLWDRALTDEEFAALASNPWQIFAERRLLIPIGAAGGATVTAITSLGAAIQAARSVTATVSAGISSGRSATSAVGAAVAAAASGQSTLDAAVQAARSATAGVQAALQAAGQRTASTDAALQIARSAGTALDMAVSAQRAATASVSAQVQGASSLAASVDAFVQAGQSASVSVAAAILRQAVTAGAALDAGLQLGRAQTTGLNGALQVASAAAATIDVALQVMRTGSAGISAQVQAGTTLNAAVEAAIQAARYAVASVQAAISVARSANLALGGAVMLQASASAVAGAAVAERRAAIAALSAYIEDPAAYSGSLDIIALRSAITMQVQLRSRIVLETTGSSPLGE